MDNEKEQILERPSSFWNKVFIGVVISDVVVVTALWAFSQYFK